MQENNFEKQVQQKMEELSFTPSAPVWQNVEAQIRKKKDRRRMVLWLLPLVLLTGSLVWWQYGVLNKNETLGNTAHRPTENKNAFKNPYNKNQKEANTTPAFNNKTSSQQEVPGTAPVTVNEQENTTAKKVITKAAQNKVGLSDVDKNKIELRQNLTKTKFTKQPAITKDLDDINKVTEEVETSIVNDSAAVVTTDALIEETVAIPTTGDSASAVDNSKIHKNETIASLAHQKKIENKARQWQREIYARAGVSGLRTELMNVFAAQSLMDYQASPSTGNSAPLFGGATNKTNSLSFAIGAGVKRKWGKKSFVTAGLQYSYYSMNRKVGTKMSGDTTVLNNGNTIELRDYYSGSTNAQTYRTQFHYLELPVAFEYQLFQNLPLHLRHGISVGYLINNNALYLDRQAAIYYESDQWLRKTSFNLFTTLDYRVLKSSRLSFYAGPQLQWNLSPLQKGAEQQKEHLFFGGLHTRIAF